jgi:twitching motility protein PilT
MNISNYFKEAIAKKASDLHLVANSSPYLRINGELIKIANKILNPQELRESIYDILNPEVIKKFEKKKDLDFSYNFFGSRFRINIHYQKGDLGLTARLIPLVIPTPEELGFDKSFYKMSRMRDGLILVTGPTGSGKSTTLASMVDIINQERKAHIITIEDPIEYIFKEKESLIEQRELGQDTDSFARALKYVLRQDPNVIMVGEMRDLETISAALTAAETGHLVISTLHTGSAVETIGRIVDVFPDYRQPQILIQLASNLRVVISQQLLPKIDGGLVAAREIIVNTQAVSNLIRTSKVSQIYSAIQTGQKEGMITMNKDIDRLVAAGLVDKAIAVNRKRDMETKASYFEANG